MTATFYGPNKEPVPETRDLDSLNAEKQRRDHHIGKLRGLLESVVNLSEELHSVNRMLVITTKRAEEDKLAIEKFNKDIALIEFVLANTERAIKEYPPLTTSNPTQELTP